MNLAICDDDINLLSIMERDVLESDLVKSVRSFSDIGSFWDTIRRGQQYDVVLMDIEWNQKQNGIDFAQRLYNECPHTQIIYVTGYESRFMHNIFFQEANLSGYLGKPLKVVELEIILRKIIKQRERQKDQIIISYKKITQQLYTEEILYIESKAHLIHIHTEKEMYFCREKLDQIETRLPDSFMRPHKSFLVNMEQIKQLDNKFIILQNGITIPVSRNKYEIIKKQFFRYKGKMLEEKYGFERDF